jgi:hypothetical protein
LHDMQTLGGPPEMQFLSHRNEVRQMPEVHPYTTRPHKLTTDHNT